MTPLAPRDKGALSFVGTGSGRSAGQEADTEGTRGPSQGRARTGAPCPVSAAQPRRQRPMAAGPSLGFKGVGASPAWGWGVC